MTCTRIDVCRDLLVRLDQPSEMFLAVDFSEPDCLEFRWQLGTAATVLKNQKFITFASHCFPSFTMVLIMMSSLRMAATRATIFGFPFLTSRL